MEYLEFVNQVSKDIKRVLPNEFQSAEVTAKQIDKLQGASYYGIAIHPENSNMGISMNLSNAFELMESGRPYDEVLAELGTAFADSFATRPNISGTELTDYEAMKDKLMIQVVPTAGNEEMLADIPHMEKEDMSIVYRIVIESNEKGSSTVLITNQMLEVYGISAEQLYADAMVNAPKHFPASVRSMLEVLAEMMGIEPKMMPEEHSGMYVATCNQGVNGAGCIFYPGFMDQAAKKLGGDFFVLPSSVHEVILLPDADDLSFHELESMVREVNATEVSPKERLSGNVYHYDSKAHIFEKAQTYNERRQKND